MCDSSCRSWTFAISAGNLRWETSVPASKSLQSNYQHDSVWKEELMYESERSERRSYAKPPKRSPAKDPSISYSKAEAFVRSCLSRMAENVRQPSVSQSPHEFRLIHSSDGMAAKSCTPEQDFTEHVEAWFNFFGWLQCRAKCSRASCEQM